MISMFLEQASGNAKGAAGLSSMFMVVYVIVLVGFFYFMFMRPQKKEQKKLDELRDGLKPGDNIMTTGGFYGVVLDVVDDTVIVEFGNNKNCRIPMNKNAIADVERDGEPEDSKESRKKS